MKSIESGECGDVRRDEEFKRLNIELNNEINHINEGIFTEMICGNKDEFIQHMSKVMELSEKQLEAVRAINDNNVCVITGGPGTGKTTIIKTILELYKQEGKKVVLCAPTGRAAKRMSETTGEDAKTLHRLLELGKIV